MFSQVIKIEVGKTYKFALTIKKKGNIILSVENKSKYDDKIIYFHFYTFIMFNNTGLHSSMSMKSHPKMFHEATHLTGTVSKIDFESDTCIRIFLVDDEKLHVL